MNSLGSKIQFTFIVSISVVALCALVLLSINQVSSLQTQQIIDTMTTEYSLISLSNEFVQTYNAVAKNPENTELASKYQTLHDKILFILKTLNAKITQEETQMLLVGVDSTVRTVIDECDAGLSEIQQNNFETFSDHYAQANKYIEFVNDNTRTLLGKELEILYQSQQNIRRMYILTIVGTLVVFLIIIGIIIGLARSFTIQLVRPLIALSVFAKEIAGGNLQAREKQTFKITNDEIGSLTQSIQTMVDKLVTMIDKEHHTNEELKVASGTLSEKNVELQKMNTIMVGRELKMIELKKEIERLQSKLNAPPTTLPPTA